ncbi:MAG TPA: mechanosensitive ion channel [Candidatus Limnocylindrales bacterium]|nr:mechanosensitive ion channel [Candidatus Limnocylindrales bacterium]
MDLGDTLSASFNQVVNDMVTALPAILGAIIILLVGYVIARVVSGIVRGLLQRAGADKALAERGQQVYGARATSFKLSSIAGTIVFWVIMVVFLIAAANFLGWPQVSDLLNGFIGWLPNLIVAVIILIAAPIIGRMVRGAVETGSAQMGMSSGSTLGRLAEIGIIAFAVLIAINQVGIASDLVNILFIGLVAALALAFGLAFGLGGRDVAGQVTQDWYDRSKGVAEKAQRQSTPASPTPTPTPPVRQG